MLTGRGPGEVEAVPPMAKWTRVESLRWFSSWLSGGACLTGDYAITIHAERPDRRKRDLGNLLKPIEDALVEAGVIEDDSKATNIHMAWVGKGRECTIILDAAEKARAHDRQA